MVAFSPGSRRASTSTGSSACTAHTNNGHPLLLCVTMAWHCVAREDLVCVVAFSIAFKHSLFVFQNTITITMRMAQTGVNRAISL